MRTGDIILVPFPFSELTNKKVRPAVVITLTKDKYKDIVLAAISSVVSQKITANEMILPPSAANKLRAVSVIKVDRIVTLKKENMIARLGKLTDDQLTIFKMKFKNLVESR